jgi:hypothetical protein
MISAAATGMISFDFLSTSDLKAGDWVYQGGKFSQASTPK